MKVHEFQDQLSSLQAAVQQAIQEREGREEYEVGLELVGPGHPAEVPSEYCLRLKSGASVAWKEDGPFPMLLVRWEHDGPFPL